MAKPSTPSPESMGTRTVRHEWKFDGNDEAMVEEMLETITSALKELQHTGQVFKGELGLKIDGRPPISIKFSPSPDGTPPSAASILQDLLSKRSGDPTVDALMAAITPTSVSRISGTSSDTSAAPEITGHPLNAPEDEWVRFCGLGSAVYKLPAEDFGCLDSWLENVYNNLGRRPTHAEIALYFIMPTTAARVGQRVVEAVLSSLTLP